MDSLLWGSTISGQFNFTSLFAAKSKISFHQHVYLLEGPFDVVTLFIIGVLSLCEIQIEDSMTVLLEEFKVPA